MSRSPRAALAPARSSRGAVLVLGIALAVAACATQAKKEEQECAPGAQIFCRCQDRREGSKQCNEDGQGYGPCEPCPSFDDSFDDPESGEDRGVDDPYEPMDDDGGAPPSASCNNGKVEPGEDCDDGNKDEEDGCDSSCKLAGTTPFATNGCPGLEVHVWGGAHAPTFSSTTVGSGNRAAAPSCATSPHPTTGSTAPDRVFKVIVHEKGTLKVTTSDVGYRMFLYASTTCAPSANAYVACANEVDGSGPEELAFPVEADETYHVFVDGSGTGSGNQGAFRVTFQIF